MDCNPLEFEGIDYICQKLNIMVILDKPITREELVRLAENFYGDMIKGVVDVDQELLALDAELHSDLEGLLLREGSQQEALWESISIPRLMMKTSWSLIR